MASRAFLLPRRTFAWATLLPWKPSRSAAALRRPAYLTPPCGSQGVATNRFTDKNIRPATRPEALDAARKIKAGMQQGTEEFTALHDVTEHLEKVQSHATTIGQSETLKFYRELNLGVQVLSWLQQRYLLDRPDRELDREFPKILCFFLILEGRADLIWKWIRLTLEYVKEQRQQGRQSAPSKTQQSVLNCMSSGVIDALIELAHGRNPSRAIKASLFLYKLCDPRGPYDKMIDPTGIGVAVEHRLRQSDCPRCDVELFEAFTRRVVYYTPPARLKYQLGLQWLYHPTHPTADTLHLCASGQCDPISNQMFARTLGARHEASMRIAYDCLRAAYIMRLRGREAEAANLDAVVMRNNEPVWEKREQGLAELERDPKLDVLRAECQAGRQSSE